MNTQAIRTVLVTDLERRLKGIITDGDARRGLFESLGLDSEVRLVMTSNPITAKEGASGFELADVMKKRDFVNTCRI